MKMRNLMALAGGSLLVACSTSGPEAKTTDDSALESSSYMRTGWIMAWFTANIGYHHIHHLNARIPFYRWPEAQKAVPELQQPKITTLNPFEILRCRGGSRTAPTTPG